MVLVLPPNSDIIPRRPSSPTLDSRPVLQVPNVFVIPPEEEQEYSAPYCCFDAAAPMEDELADIESLDAALNLVHQSSNSPMSYQPYQTNWDFRLQMPICADVPRPQSQLAQEWEHAVREARRHYEDDSEIIEVIKVRRNEGLNERFNEGLGDGAIKKNRTLKSRASRAFMSIRNMSKGNRKTSAISTFAQREEYRDSLDSTATSARSTSESGPDQVDRSRAQSPDEPPRKLSRRKSLTLSSIFAMSHGNRSSSSVNVDRAVSQRGPSSADQEPDRTISPSSSMGSSITSTSESSASAEDTELFMPVAPPEDLPPRPTSSLSVKRSFRKRLSTLNLSRIFTSSAETDSPSEASTTRPVPAPYSIPMPMSPDSRVSVQFSSCPTEPSSEALATPTDDVHRSPTLQSLPRFTGSSSLELNPLGIVTQNDSQGTIPPSKSGESLSASESRESMSPSESTGSMTPSESTTTEISEPLSDTEPDDEDETGQMTLDSLHFDTLQFDAEDFTIPHP
ncbi:hypothetical protein OE88DRAFT_1805660 [Heliocybe sulcata]|uniref:Uncharacterized protein n=1 Tax=Heliocybe sulcata TaxID=5364 RepID=A0A5C3ND82_9AGAM|nr:hypothetical protein OE88DRAFT_1805660 [Heliocybe sulcata]